jgi:hypothetical protein
MAEDVGYWDTMDWEGAGADALTWGAAGLSTGIWPLAVAGLVAGFFYGLATEGDPELANLMNQRNKATEKWMNEGLGLSRQEVQKYMGLTRTPETGQTARALMTSAEGAPWQAAQTQMALKDAGERERQSEAAGMQAIGQLSDQQAQYKKQMINQLNQQIAQQKAAGKAGNSAQMQRALDPATLAKSATTIGKIQGARMANPVDATAEGIAAHGSVADQQALRRAAVNEVRYTPAGQPLRYNPYTGEPL